MFPVDVAAVSPVVCGRDSNLSSVDDELSWDPGDKVLGEETEATDQETEATDQENQVSPSPDQEEGSQKSRGSSLTECSPVWEGTDVVQETLDTDVEDKVLGREETFDYSHDMAAEQPATKSGMETRFKLQSPS